MQLSVTRARGVAVRRRGPAHPPALPVPIGFLGQSLAPVIPQQVGSWWLEPLGPATTLPPRAQRRLRAILAAGYYVGPALCLKAACRGGGSGAATHGDTGGALRAAPVGGARRVSPIVLHRAVGVPEET